MSLRARRERILAALLVLAACPACLRVDDFIYQAKTTDQYVLDPSLVPEADRNKVELIARDGTRLLAVELYAKDPNGRTVLYFHGNAGHIDDYWERAARLYGLGFDVLIVDYRGFGKSEGHPSETGLYEDGDAAWSHLTEAMGVAPGNAIVYGYSLGGGVACEVALRHRPGALVLESTFSNVADQLTGTFYLEVPRGLMADAVFDNTAKVAQLEGIPKLIMHGESDRTFPPVNARRLYDAAAQPRRLALFPGADHVSVYGSDPERYRQEMTRFE
jgi:uncharacterized protein